MPRRAGTEESDNIERWMISYADFITLLFAFFVVMYSISSVNEGKYKVLSETLIGAFNEPKQPSKTTDELQLQQHSTNSLIEFPSQTNKTGDVSSEQTNESDETGESGLDKLSQDVEGAFADLIEDDDIAIDGNETWVEISLSSSLLFGSGSARPNPQALPVLNKIADLLAGYENPVHVEGFTDNIPIKSSVFPSNWELSAARSATVVRLLAEGGVDPDRMAAVGYAEFQPLASNDDAEGRSQNRRVVLVVSRDLNVRKSISGADDLGAKNVDRQLQVENANSDNNAFLKEKNRVKTVELENGGLLFTQDE